MDENKNNDDVIECNLNALEMVSGGKDVIGNTFTQISQKEAASEVKKKEPVVYLDEGYYEVNNSVRFFKKGYYRVSK